MTAAEQKKIFNAWLSSHRGLLFKVIRSYATTKDDQDDLFQEIAIQLWNSIPNFRLASSVPTWLYKVALYTAMGWSRKERKHFASRNELAEKSSVLLRADDGETSSLDWLYEQINLLDELDRSIILLVLDGFAYKKIADILGISENHVGVKVHRIKKELSKHSKKFAHHGI